MSEAASAPTPTKPVQKKKPAVKKGPSLHPPYNDMIIQAITSLKDKKGSSRQNISKYIKANYKVGDNCDVHLKMQLKRMVGNGKLSQTSGQGANGSFKIKKEVKPAAKKPAKPKAAAKKATTGKTTTKKPAAKKATTKKVTKPKPAAKKAAAKKPAAKKAAAKKPAVKKDKPAAKKAAAKKVTKPAAKKAAKPKKPAAKTASKKPAAKK